MARIPGRSRQVEELGFDTISFADHFTDWTGKKGPWLELWSQVSAIAMATKHIRLATLVAQIPFRNPAMFALQALTVDHISGGRLDLGLGTGLGVDPSYRMMGVANWSAKERVARFGEYVEIVSQLLSREEISYQGHYYHLDAAAISPRPVQSPHPPIIVAAMGRHRIVILRPASRPKEEEAAEPQETARSAATRTPGAPPEWSRHLLLKTLRPIMLKMTLEVPFRGYLAGSVGRVSGEFGEVRLVPLGRSWITGHGGGVNGFHPAIVLTCARALALSVIPGNRRRNSIAADSSPSWLKMARIASASASVTRNIPKAW